MWVILQIKKAAEYMHIAHTHTKKTLSHPKGTHGCQLVSPRAVRAHIPGMCIYVSLSHNALDESTPKTYKLTSI